MYRPESYNVLDIDFTELRKKHPEHVPVVFKGLNKLYVPHKDAPLKYLQDMRYYMTRQNQIFGAPEPLNSNETFGHLDKRITNHTGYLSLTLIDAKQCVDERTPLLS